MAGKRWTLKKEDGQYVFKFYNKPSRAVQKLLQNKGWTLDYDDRRKWRGEDGLEQIKKAIAFWEKKREFASSSNTLCWTCANAYCQCSWSKNFTPVEGWVAERRILYRHGDEGDMVYLDSYSVEECPQYEEEVRR